MKKFLFGLALMAAVRDEVFSLIIFVILAATFVVWLVGESDKHNKF